MPFWHFGRGLLFSFSDKNATFIKKRLRFLEKTFIIKALTIKKSKKVGYTVKEFTVREESDLKTFTDNVYAQGSFWFRTLLKKKDIRVNGQKTDRNVPVYKGDIVRYYLTSEQDNTPAFHSVYEDGNLLIVDKESGVNSEAVFSALEKRGARFIHRLDRNTKGLIVFALNDETERELLRLFKEREIEKRYLAVVCGEVKETEKTLTAYLVKDSQNAKVRVLDEKIAGGEKIVTEYKTLERANGFSLLEIRLHTGKTHQIRAHMSHIGYPVLGDAKYGLDGVNRAFSATRQSLVAKSLTFHSNGILAYLNGRTFYSRFDCQIPNQEK